MQPSDGVGPGPALRYAVVEEIRGLIVSGMLLPGQQLREDELATELGVSKGSVKAALQLLEVGGWADIQPRSGAFVREPTVREMDEIFELRCVLNAHTARVAAVHATSEDLTRLEMALARSDEELSQPQTHRRGQARESVHSCIREIAGNRRVSELLHDLDQRVAWLFVPLVRSRRDQATREHRALVDAIGEGDADAAAGLARDHAEATRRSFHTWRHTAAAEHERTRHDPGEHDDTTIEDAP